MKNADNNKYQNDEGLTSNIIENKVIMLKRFIDANIWSTKKRNFGPLHSLAIIKLVTISIKTIAIVYVSIQGVVQGNQTRNAFAS